MLHDMRSPCKSKWLALYGRNCDGDQTSRQYAIMAIKEVNNGTIDVMSNDSRSERWGGRIGGVFGT